MGTTLTDLPIGFSVNLKQCPGYFAALVDLESSDD